MRLLKTIPLVIFAAINLLVIVAMNYCAYTSTLPPQDYAKWSYFGLMFPAFLSINVIFVFFWLIFKWKWACIPLIGMLFCAGDIRACFPINFPSTPPAGSIKVLSYNVMAFGDDGTGKSKADEWQKNPILRYLLESDADVICLQEARKSFIDAAIDSISAIYPYHHERLETDNYIACFSKHPLDYIEEIDYPTTTNHSHVYRLKRGEDTLIVINNHLESYRLSKEDKNDYKSIIKNYRAPNQNDSKTKYQTLMEKLSHHDSIRGLQVDSVVAYINRHPNERIILCGDLNATPVSYIHNRLTSVLNDAYTRSGNGPGISYNRSGMYFRLDHIMVSPSIKTYGATVDQSIKYSDHYPIYCFLNWE